MPEYSGSACILQWIWSGGTVSLHGDYRRLSVKPKIKTINGTAGSDAREVKYPSVKDADVSYQLVAQTGGTAVLAALAEGVQGTLIVGPEGTATNKPKTTISMISMGVQQEIPYDDVVTLSGDFTADGTTYMQGAY